MNAQGYLYAKGQIKTLPNTTGDAVQFNLNVRTEVISIYNPGPLRVWARGDGTIAEAGAPSIPIEPGLTLTIPLRSAPGATQFSLIPQSQPTVAIEVSIMACGNSLSCGHGRCGPPDLRKLKADRFASRFLLGLPSSAADASVCAVGDRSPDKRREPGAERPLPERWLHADTCTGGGAYVRL